MCEIVNDFFSQMSAHTRFLSAPFSPSFTLYLSLSLPLPLLLPLLLSCTLSLRLFPGFPLHLSASTLSLKNQLTCGLNLHNFTHFISQHITGVFDDGIFQSSELQRRFHINVQCMRVHGTEHVGNNNKQFWWSQKF